ncbi:MAG: TRAP transporter small permease [Paracoccaceae bacterium]|nr:TRAP transporter small permease [Paracoccaceae bacterium]
MVKHSEAENSATGYPQSTLWRVTEQAVAVLGGGALVALMLLTVTDALMRSILNRPVMGGGDLIQIVLVLVVAAAVPLSVAAGRAIAIDFVVTRLPSAVSRPLLRLTSATSAIAFGYLAWRCQINAGEAAMFGETTMLLQIPYGPFYQVLALSFALCAALFATESLRGRLFK